MKKKPIKYSDIPPPEPSVVQESPIPHLNVVPKEVGAFDGAIDGEEAGKAGGA